MDRVKYGQPTNYIVEDFDLSEIINLMRELVAINNRNDNSALAKEFRKYFKEGASGGKNDVSLQNAINKYLSKLSSIQASGKAASDLTPNEKLLVKKAVSEIGHNLSILSKQNNARTLELVKYMRGFFSQFTNSYVNNILQREYKRWSGATTPLRAPTVPGGTIMQDVGRMVREMYSPKGRDYSTPPSTGLGAFLNYQGATLSRLYGSPLMGGMNYNIDWSKLTGLSSQLSSDYSSHLEEIKANG